MDPAGWDFSCKYKHPRRPQKQDHLSTDTNIDLKLRNKLHGPMHYKIGDTCVFNGYKINTLL